MNKDEIVKQVAMELGMTKKEVSLVADKIFEAIVSELEKGNDVRIADFGKFEIRNRIPRIGVNPITKEPIEILGLKAVAFHASQSVRDTVNKDRK